MIQEGIPRRAWVVVACAWLLCFAMFGRILSLPPIAHMVMDELSLTHGKVGLIFSLPLAILAATAILSGLLGDRIGSRKAAGLGSIIMTAGSFVTGTATDFFDLFVYTCIFGSGFSIVFTNLPKLMGIWFPKEKVGLATGLYGTGLAVGAAIALGITLPLVFPITNTFRGTFYIWSLPALVAMIIWWLVVKDPPASSRSTQGQRASEKKIHLILKNRSLWMVDLGFFCLLMMFYTWSAWTPKIMVLKGASPDQASLMISWMQWVSIPFMFLMPWAAHRVGLTKPFLWGSGFMAALVALIAIYMTVPMGWVIMTLLGIAMASFPLLLALPVQLVPEESAATASGMVLSIGNVGSLVGPWLAGYILDVTGTLDLALVVLVGVGIAMAVFAFMLPETGSRIRGDVVD